MRKLLLFVVLFAHGCATDNPAETAAITSDSQMASVLREAQTLSEEALKLQAAGQPLTDVQKDDLVKADRLFDSLISYAPDVMTFYLGKAKIKNALDNPAAALAVLLQSSRAIPDTVSTDADRATVAEIKAMAADLQIDRNEYEDALVNVTHARRLEPTNVDYMATEVRILIQQRDYPRAKMIIGEGLKLRPDHSRLNQLKKLLEVSAKK